MGYQLYCTKGTYEFFWKKLENSNFNYNAILVHKPHVRKSPNVTELISNGKIDLVINVPDSMDSQGVTDGFKIRRLAVDSSVSLLNDVKTTRLFIESLYRKHLRESAGKPFWGIDNWQHYQTLD